MVALPLQKHLGITFLLLVLIALCLSNEPVYGFADIIPLRAATLESRHRHCSRCDASTKNALRATSNGFQQQQQKEEETKSLNDEFNSRRMFLSKSLACSALSLSPLWMAPTPATASKNQDLVQVYFGCGCFWHVQHEFVEAERKLLKRSKDEITARVGYAGGIAGAQNGKVCYHNRRGISDYGALGHAEVVSLRIPPSSFPDFCQTYASLFDRFGLRPDQLGDRGLEYRNLVGLPLTTNPEWSKVLVQEVQKINSKLEFSAGQGDDADVARQIYIMDIEKYPFFVGEQYHQFHDGFQKGENYPDTYNQLADYFADFKSEDFGSCPSRL